MAKATLGTVFLLVCLVGRFVGMAVLFAIKGIQYDLVLLINPWTAYVVSVTSVAAYALSFLWLKGRHWLITAAITGAVATLVFIPSIQGSKGIEAFYSLSYVLVEWFAIGALAHAACTVAARLSTRTKPIQTRYW